MNFFDEVFNEVSEINYYLKDLDNSSIEEINWIIYTLFKWISDTIKEIFNISWYGINHIIEQIYKNTKNNNIMYKQKEYKLITETKFMFNLWVWSEQKYFFEALELIHDNFDREEIKNNIRKIVEKYSVKKEDNEEIIKNLEETNFYTDSNITYNFRFFQEFLKKVLQDSITDININNWWKKLINEYTNMIEKISKYINFEKINFSTSQDEDNNNYYLWIKLDIIK